MSKEQLFFAVNSNYNNFLNYFFYCVTELGNTWTYIAVILISLFYPRKFTLMLIAGLLLSTVFAQGLKHFVFDNAARPLKYFSDPTMVHHLSISKLLYNHSFPSGHSVSIFTLITIVISFFKQRKYDLLLLFIAVLAAYSRVYLGQHFVEDVAFGSFIGVFSGTVIIFLFLKIKTTFEKPFIKFERKI